MPCPARRSLDRSRCEVPSAGAETVLHVDLYVAVSNAARPTTCPALDRGAKDRFPVWSAAVKIVRPC